MADPNKTLCASLWNLLDISVDRMGGNIVKHPKSIFLGYADVTITGRAGSPAEGFAFKVRGIECKILKGNHHIDFPSERGADGKYYPQCFPKTPETRAILLMALFASDVVQAAVEKAAQAPMASGTEEAPTAAEAGAAAPVSNPFTA